MKSPLLLIWLLLFAGSTPVIAQDNANLPDTNSKRKLLLHFDKGSYYAGDTVFFKAYVYSDFTLDVRTSNLLVGLFNNKGNKISEKRFPVLGGLCSGNMELPDTLAHGLYYFQALTARQFLNKDSIGYIRQLFVLNTKKIPADLTNLIKPEYHIGFFPQGGNLVNELSNEVYYRATDQFGNLVPVKGKLIDEKNELVTEFETSAGQGSFFFLPTLHEYFAVIKFPNSEERRFALPQIKEEGVTFRLSNDGLGKNYIIETNMKGSAELELLGEMNESPLIQQVLKINGNSIRGSIPSSKLPSGILNLAIRDKNGKIYAENRCLIDNKEYLKEVKFEFDTLNFHANGDNVLSFVFQDSIWAGFSLSVIDPRIAEPLFSIDNSVVNDALYQNERKVATKNSDNIFIYDSMWKKPDWNEIFATERKIGKNDEDFITVKGSVYKEDTKKLVTEGMVNFMVTTRDSINTFLFAPVDKDGRFELRNLVFEDTASFRFQMNKGRVGGIMIIPDKTEFHLPAQLPLFETSFLNYDRIRITDTSKYDPIVSLFDQLNEGKYRVLEGVTVTAVRKRNPTMLVNQRYTSGLFSGMGQARLLDLINDPPNTGMNVFDYIAAKIPGVHLRRSGLDYVLESPRAISIGNMIMSGNAYIPGRFYLNEIEAQSRDISFLPLSQIALIKYFPPGSTQIADGSVAPVLAVYTKQFEDQKGAYGSSVNLYIPGYSPSDLLYDDSYNLYYSGKKGTILWRPDIFISGETNLFKIRFRNPYEAHSFKVVLQGVTMDGELIYFEKLVSAN